MGNFRTIEERRAYYRNLHKRHLEEWTPEQLAEHKRKTKEAWIKWRENQSKEKQEEIHEKVKAHQREVWRSMSPEKKEMELQRLKKIYVNMTPEEKKKKHDDEQRWRWELKIMALNHYSNGTLKCVNSECEVPGGSKNLLSLQIDHIHGGGRRHAMQIRGLGSHFYLWLYNNNFPEGYQVLCANCNVIKKVKNREGCKENWERFAKEHEVKKND
jgi:hypothetical protein